MNHHAFVIEAEKDAGIARAKEWLAAELSMDTGAGNPDLVVREYGLLSVEDARGVCELAAGAPFSGKSKAVIVSALRAYHEAQNALLKLFEEPPQGTYLFLVLPSLGGLLPTLRSRVQELKPEARSARSEIDPVAQEFLKGSKEKRSALVKKLTSGKDEDARREGREEAIALINGIEAAAYAALREKPGGAVAALLSDIAVLRGHLYDRSAPVKMILEHLSLVIPRNLL